MDRLLSIAEPGLRSGARSGGGAEISPRRPIREAHELVNDAACVVVEGAERPGRSVCLLGVLERSDIGGLLLQKIVRVEG